MISSAPRREKDKCSGRSQPQLHPAEYDSLRLLRIALIAAVTSLRHITPILRCMCTRLGLLHLHRIGSFHFHAGHHLHIFVGHGCIVNYYSCSARLLRSCLNKISNVGTTLTKDESGKAKIRWKISYLHRLKVFNIQLFNISVCVRDQHFSMEGPGKRSMRRVPSAQCFPQGPESAAAPAAGYVFFCLIATPPSAGPHGRPNSALY